MRADIQRIPPGRMTAVNRGTHSAAPPRHVSHTPGASTRPAGAPGPGWRTPGRPRRPGQASKAPSHSSVSGPWPGRPRSGRRRRGLPWTSWPSSPARGRAAVLGRTAPDRKPQPMLFPGLAQHRGPGPDERRHTEDGDVPVDTVLHGLRLRREIRRSGWRNDCPSSIVKGRRTGGTAHIMRQASHGDRRCTVGFLEHRGGGGCGGCRLGTRSGSGRTGLSGGWAQAAWAWCSRAGPKAGAWSR